MQIRIALTETNERDGRNEAYVIAWPLDNDPRHANAPTAQAIQRQVGGLPVVVVALADTRELHSHGQIEHVLSVVEAGLDGYRWVMFDVDLNVLVSHP